MTSSEVTVSTQPGRNITVTVKKPRETVINLRSDTFSEPTEAMRDAMVTVPLGNDVYGKDPTVNKLQEKCAALLGKEAALLVPTASMGNLAAFLSHCDERFQEVLLRDQSHIYLTEMAGITALAGVQPRVVITSPDCTLHLEGLRVKVDEAQFRDRSNPHSPQIRMICLENTHSRCGGRVLSLEYMKQVRDLADAHEMVVLLDGARMMNAACALEEDASTIAYYFDSVTMCFTTGLSCPVGSILAGSTDFIKRAARARKALGGGIRQAGVIAAPMLIALRDIVPLLKKDHENACKIAQAVADLGAETSEGVTPVTVDMDSVETNIVLLHTTSNETTETLCRRLAEVTEGELSEGVQEKVRVQASPVSDTALRLVTHQDITGADVDETIRKLRYVLKEMATEEIVTEMVADQNELLAEKLTKLAIEQPETVTEMVTEQKEVLAEKPTKIAAEQQSETRITLTVRQIGICSKAPIQVLTEKKKD